MKLVIYAIIATALLAVAGCTTDDYNGCRGKGCLVDRPHKSGRNIDSRPQYDRSGNPNFDTRAATSVAMDSDVKSTILTMTIKPSTTGRSTTNKAIPTSIRKATIKAATASAARSIRRATTAHRTTTTTDQPRRE